MRTWSPNELYHFPYDKPVHVDVTNRVFLLGLDEIYRSRMKRFEERTLLPLAQIVATRLNIQPGDIPVEGYYAENKQLTLYFRLLRTLQQEPIKKRADIDTLPEFQKLFDVVSSPIFGKQHDSHALLPQAQDPLTIALGKIGSLWNTDNILVAAHDIALQTNDISLVGLASRAGDVIVATALRESVVLYVEALHLGTSTPTFIYNWQVDPSLAAAANHFIYIFNELIKDDVPSRFALPSASPENGEDYYFSYLDNDFLGRCVCLGTDPSSNRKYHWAVLPQFITQGNVEYILDEFWSNTLWTTEMYRKYQRSKVKMRVFSKEGVPEHNDLWNS